MTKGILGIGCQNFSFAIHKRRHVAKASAPLILREMYSAIGLWFHAPTAYTYQEHRLVLHTMPRLKSIQEEDTNSSAGQPRNLRPAYQERLSIGVRSKTRSRGVNPNTKTPHQYTQDTY
jgi:hypothetical protein